MACPASSIKIVPGRFLKQKQLEKDTKVPLSKSFFSFNLAVMVLISCGPALLASLLKSSVCSGQLFQIAKNHKLRKIHKFLGCLRARL